MAKRNKLANKCHNRIYRAIRRGEIDPPYYLPCQDCGCGPSEYDHEWGYRWWWKVVPRCRVCHNARHRRVVKERKEKKDARRKNAL